MTSILLFSVCQNPMLSLLSYSLLQMIRCSSQTVHTIMLRDNCQIVLSWKIVIFCMYQCQVSGCIAPLEPQNDWCKSAKYLSWNKKRTNRTKVKLWIDAVRNNNPLVRRTTSHASRFCSSRNSSRNFSRFCSFSRFFFCLSRNWFTTSSARLVVFSVSLKWWAQASSSFALAQRAFSTAEWVRKWKPQQPACKLWKTFD